MQYSLKVKMRKRRSSDGQTITFLNHHSRKNTRTGWHQLWGNICKKYMYTPPVVCRTYYRLNVWFSFNYRTPIHLTYAQYQVFVLGQASLPAIHQRMQLNLVHNAWLKLVWAHTLRKKFTLVSPQTFKYNKLSSCSKTWFWPTTERRSLGKCLRKRVCHWCEGIVVSRRLPYKNHVHSGMFNVILRESVIERESGSFVLKLLLSTNSNETLSKLAPIVYLCYVPHELGEEI